MEGVIYDPIPIWSFLISVALIAAAYALWVAMGKVEGWIKRTGEKRHIEIQKTGGRRTHAD